MSEGPVANLIKPHTLPDEAFEQARRELVLPDPVAKSLARYIELIQFVLTGGMAQSPLNGVVIFRGPPGCGKSLAAGAMSQAMAAWYHQACRSTTILFRVRVPQLMSEFLGKTVQAVGQLFEAVAFSAERRLTIVLIEELESMGFSRERVGASDPTDVIRMVDELLRQLDALRGNPRFVLIGTTNTVGMIDDALIDRADLVVQVDPPDYDASLKILQRAADRARGLGIDLDHRELVKTAKALSENGHKASGRFLSKLPLLGFVEGGSRRPTAAVLIEVAKRKIAEDFPWL